MFLEKLFVYIGLDFLGLLYICDEKFLLEKSFNKVYVCLFICVFIRVIGLELILWLSVDFFLLFFGDL